MPNATRLEWIGKYAAILSALVAMAVGIGQYRRGVSQSIKELEWRQADMARTMINAMMDDEGWQAMTMLDWEEGRTYEIAPGTNVRILRTMFLWPLKQRCERKDDSARRHSDSSPTIRPLSVPCSQLQAAVRSGLVRLDDVRFPLNW